MSKKEENIVVYEYDPLNPPPLTEEQKRELEALANMPDSEIDYSDIPEITDFSGFRRVAPRSSFVRIDGDLLDWIQATTVRLWSTTSRASKCWPRTRTKRKSPLEFSDEQFG